MKYRITHHTECAPKHVGSYADINDGCVISLEPIEDEKLKKHTHTKFGCMIGCKRCHPIEEEKCIYEEELGGSDTRKDSAPSLKTVEQFAATPDSSCPCGCSINIHDEKYEKSHREPPQPEEKCSDILRRVRHILKTPEGARIDEQAQRVIDDIENCTSEDFHFAPCGTYYNIEHGKNCDMCYPDLHREGPCPCHPLEDKPTSPPPTPTTGEDWEKEFTESFMACWLCGLTVVEIDRQEKDCRKHQMRCYLCGYPMAKNKD